MSDIILQENQILIEHWRVEYVGKSRMRAPQDEWVEARIVKMYHSTVYGGANGFGKTVEEARLNAVLGLARAICDDDSAFQHDADEIFKAEQYRWWSIRIKELGEELEDNDTNRASYRKIQRRIKLTEELFAIWQEEHDYWPEEEKG